MHTFLILALTFVAPTQEDWVAHYEEASTNYTGGEYQNEKFHYRIMKPRKTVRGRKYPLVLFLHGKGGQGNDNRAQLEFFAKRMAEPAMRQKFPCFVIAPQCREGKPWASPSPDEPSEAMQIAMRIIEKVLADEPADPKRVYLTGLSMGGAGAWDAATRWPERFAAVAPICGGGNVSLAVRLVDVPIWAVHGDADEIVPVARTQDMVNAVRQAGGKPKISVLPGVGHNSWVRAYNDPKGVIPWMFKQVNRHLPEDAEGTSEE